MFAALDTDEREIYRNRREPFHIFATPSVNYSEQRGHPADFEVRYRFYKPEEGGRLSGPSWQHYRCDWAYEGDDIAAGIYMIWPEFISEDGSIQPEGSPVPWSGTATMWILIPELRAQIHPEPDPRGRPWLLYGG
ncbi:MAG: hypothetical protein JWM68_3012 [Verrucomicrobiales bacterium]|nr:hypothetical protein [Verrucomicrobiales bacterium]